MRPSRNRRATAAGRWLLLALLGPLAGCSTSQTIDAAADEYVDRRRSIHSDLTDGSLAWLCRGITVFEWRLRFDTAEKVAGWRAICNHQMTGTPGPAP